MIQGYLGIFRPIPVVQSYRGGTGGEHLVHLPRAWLKFQAGDPNARQCALRAAF